MTLTPEPALINRPLSAALADLAHGDEVLVCGPDFPRPDVPRHVDLALVSGSPRLTEVVDAIRGEFPIEQTTAAPGIWENNPDVAAWLDETLPVRLGTIPRDELETRSHRARLVIRTGETTPHPDVLLRCGGPIL